MREELTLQTDSLATLPFIGRTVSETKFAEANFMLNHKAMINHGKDRQLTNDAAMLRNTACAH